MPVYAHSCLGPSLLTSPEPLSSAPDPGTSTQLKALFTPDWLAGKTTATLLATVKDYMDDVQKSVEASFVKRVAEAAVEELIRRYVNIVLAGLSQVGVRVVPLQPARLRHLAVICVHLNPDLNTPCDQWYLIVTP
jgi:hypothetical protein